MIIADYLIRPALEKDQQKIANLIYFETFVHRHLDWRSPLEWLGSPHYWVAEQNGMLLAALACPPDPEEIAWIRLFASTDRLSLQQLWRSMWDVAQEELARLHDTTVAVISLQEWFRPLLKGSGFSEHQEIVTLEWRPSQLPPRSEVNDLVIRMMTPDDLPRVAEVDASAFEPLWQNSPAALRQAFPQAGLATVAELEGNLVGYQITTYNPMGGHLARLAVHPLAQRRGIGSQLLNDLLRQLTRRNIARLTVNTQGDNQRSMKLYQNLGFKRTGETYPVFARKT